MPFLITSPLTGEGVDSMPFLSTSPLMGEGVDSMPFLSTSPLMGEGREGVKSYEIVPFGHPSELRPAGLPSSQRQSPSPSGRGLGGGETLAMTPPHHSPSLVALVLPLSEGVRGRVGVRA